MASNNLDIWLKELERSREDLAEAIKKTRTTDTLIAAAFALGLGIFGALKSDLVSSEPLPVLLGSTIMSLLVDYLIVINWVYVYDMSQLSARVIALEKKINYIIGENILTWESRVNIKILTSDSLTSMKPTGVINPNTIRAGIAILLFLAFQGFLCTYIYPIQTNGELSHIWSAALGFFTLIFILFVIIQWVKTTSVGYREKVESVISNTFVDSNTCSQKD